MEGMNIQDMLNGQDLSTANVDDLIAEGYLTDAQGTCPNGAHIYISNGEAHAD